MISADILLLAGPYAVSHGSHNLPESCTLRSHRDLSPASSCSCLQVKLRVAAAKLLHQTGMDVAAQELVVKDADAACAMLERVLHQHTSGKPAESQ